MFRWIVLLCVLHIGMSEGAEFLMSLGMMVRSHHILFKGLAKGLVAAGHKVTAVIPGTFDFKSPNYTEILIPDVSANAAGSIDFTDLSDPYKSIYAINALVVNNCKYVYGSEVFQKFLLEDRHFDAVITESMAVHEALSALQHRYGAVGIELYPHGNAHWLYHMVGSPLDPSFIPECKTDLSDKMTFKERLFNLYASLASIYVGHSFIIPENQKIMDTYFRYPGWESRPPLAELLMNKSLVLMNSHHSLNYPHPLAPHVKEIAGIHLQPLKPLPADLQKTLDESKEGFIYFSWGSLVIGKKVDREQHRQAFINVFKKLKQKVFWKWREPIPGVPENVIVSPWFPQQEILSHKNCKLFLTHGGFLSMIEAVMAGVPVVGTPFYHDQMKNVKKIESLGIGLHLADTNLTEASIEWAIKEVINNKKYKENIIERSHMFNDRIRPPMEEAIYWIEYVLKHGNVLRPASTQMSLFRRFYMDLGLIVLSIFLSISFVSIVLVRALRKKSKKSKFE